MIRLLAIIEACTITGPARNLLEFARHSEAYGVETIVATFVRGQTDNLFIRTARAQGTAVELITESAAWDSTVSLKISALVARLRPDVVQTHAVKSHFLLRCSGVFALTPWVAFHHGYTWPTLKARLYNQLDRWSLRAPRWVLTVSQPFRDELVSMGVDPAIVDVIHNAIEIGWGSRHPTDAEALRKSLNIPEDRNIILIVGRLSREKDHLTLLEAVHQLKPELHAHLLLVGEGPERPRIEEKIRALKMTSQVTLAGQRDSAQPFYGLARIAVLSSLSEGSPNALLEAMSAGIPAVATRVGGVPEIATDAESALLVPPSDMARMRDALAQLLANPPFAQMLATRGKRLIAERHTPQARAARLAALYHRLAEIEVHA